jgi:uncharacterized membrane protein
MSAAALPLALAYWLHMLATVAWIGSQVAVVLIVRPALRSLDKAGQLSGPFLDRIQKRLQPITWFSLAVLAGSGLFQMSANPHYQGFLVISSPWAVSLLVKHLVFGLMIALNAYLTWGLLPDLDREVLRHLNGLPAPRLALLRRREAWLLGTNLALGLVVLALTAFLRAS